MQLLVIDAPVAAGRLLLVLTVLAITSRRSCVLTAKDR